MSSYEQVKYDIQVIINHLFTSLLKALLEYVQWYPPPHEQNANSLKCNILLSILSHLFQYTPCKGKATEVRCYIQVQR